MLFPEEIETDRLRLSRLCHDNVDLFAYHECCSHDEPEIEAVTRYLPWDPHETLKQTKEYIDALERKWADGERAEYIIRPKPTEDGAREILAPGDCSSIGRPALASRPSGYESGSGDGATPPSEPRR